MTILLKEKINNRSSNRIMPASRLVKNWCGVLNFVAKFSSPHLSGSNI